MFYSNTLCFSVSKHLQFVSLSQSKIQCSAVRLQHVDCLTTRKIKKEEPHKPIRATRYIKDTEHTRNWKARGLYFSDRK